jgi:signal recognition particle subunit SRP54
MKEFDLNDFRKQIETIRNMGSTRDLMLRIPGKGSMYFENPAAIDTDEEISRITGIIDSMTRVERHDPGQIDRSRRRRIALGSGTCDSEVASLLRQFGAMADLLRQYYSRKY